MPHAVTQRLPFGQMLVAQHPGEDINRLDIDLLADIVARERLVILRGFRTFSSASALSAYCARWGEISVWPFGQVLELVEHARPDDHIFDHSAVPLHWDGMYRPQIPALQIFHCVKAPQNGQGGRTIFSDTPRALAHASAETRRLWSRVTARYQRKMAYYDSLTVSPIIDTHPLRGYPVIRYSEPPPQDTRFINRPTITFTGIPTQLQSALTQSLREALYAPHCFYAHAWQTNDVVVADNLSLLHGREAFETRAPRHLQRVHVLSTPPLQNTRLVSHA